MNLKPTGLVIILLCVAQWSSAQEVLVLDRGSVMYPNEPSICISHTNTSTVCAGANINYRMHSVDEGKTWEVKPLRSKYGVWGDPVLHGDQHGKIYFTHLSRTEGKDKDYGFIDRIVVQRSDDGGKTYNEGSFTGLNEPKMQDKPWISSDDYSDPYDSRLYLSWTEFDKINSKKKKHHSRIRFSYSDDFAESWSEAITISDSVGDAVDDDHTLEGATTAVNREGVIYCVWAGHHKLYFDKSVDGGKTWGKDKVIANQSSGWAMDIPHLYRCNGMPFIVCDNSLGNNRGKLYVVWGDTTAGSANVYMMTSDDGGDSWSDIKQVHSDLYHPNRSQFLPNIAIDPKTGNIAVIYYDRRNSKSDVFTDVYISHSTDGGLSFNDYRLSSTLMRPAGKHVFSGDYIDIDYYNGKLAAIWSGNAPSARIYSAYIDVDTLDRLYPIHKIGQVREYHERTKKGTVITIAATTEVSATITEYKRKWFRKQSKIKREHKLDIRHRIGLEGITEKQITVRQKRRILIHAITTKSTDGKEEETTLYIH